MYPHTLNIEVTHTDPDERSAENTDKEQRCALEIEFEVFV